MGEQFADIVIKSYIIKRRFLSGLKVAYVKFLPINTLKRLVEHFEAFKWLKAHSQVDLRPLFPQAKENHFVQLYSLIGLRARVRAYDDLATLCADNMRRILKLIDRFLIKRKQISYVTEEELKALAGYANRVLNFYLEKVVEAQRSNLAAYEKQLAQAARLAAFTGGQVEFVRLLDQLIDTVALDIDLNKEATSLSLPPTISETIMANLERKWIPGELLATVEENRRILLDNKQRITSLVRLEAEWVEVDLAEKCADASLYICKNFS